MTSLLKNAKLSESRRGLYGDKNKLGFDEVNEDFLTNTIENESIPNGNNEESDLLAELEALKESVYKEAFEQGTKDAQAAIDEAISKEKEKLQELIDSQHLEQEQLSTRFESLFNALEEKSQSDFLQMEASVLRLSTESLYKLLGKREVYQELIQNTVNNALTEAREHIQVKITLSQADQAIVEQLIELDENNADIRYDQSLPTGTCLVESKSAEIDFSLNTQLDRLRETLLQTFNSRQSKDA